MKAIKTFVCMLPALAVALPSAAAPVTLAFEAEIDRLSGIPFDSGIEFAEGDVISGQFTFEPSDGDGNMHFETVQPYDFTLNINGVVLSAPEFEIEVFNDTPVLDSPLATEIDSINLGGEGLTSSSPGMLPITISVSSFRMQLSAGAGLLPEQFDALKTATIPANVATWNKFGLRRQLGLALRDNMGNVEGFQATVGAFSVVPEPATCSQVLCLTGVLGAFRIWRTRQT